jgi:uncharacterized protein (UPF0332 family)
MKRPQLLDAAELLAHANTGRPVQAFLKRAVSTAYYAAFDALASECANTLISSDARRTTRAWAQVYRALDHSVARSACQQAKQRGFPDEIVVFADVFMQLQEARHEADYNPLSKFSRSEAVALIELSEAGIRSLRQADAPHRRAFVAWVLLKRR